jgi:hypothetical protein
MAVINDDADPVQSQIKIPTTRQVDKMNYRPVIARNKPLRGNAKQVFGSLGVI